MGSIILMDEFSLAGTSWGKKGDYFWYYRGLENLLIKKKRPLRLFRVVLEFRHGFKMT